MLILNKGQQNELVLNINNNSRTDFTSYTLTFTHVVSQEVKSYTVSTSNPLVYAENDRYCEIILNFQTAGQDLNYLGQYQLEIYGNGTSLVYTGMAQLNGSQESNPFTEYVSPDEDNSNFIYIQD
jgi:hypothetical protein